MIGLFLARFWYSNRQTDADINLGKIEDVLVVVAVLFDGD